MVVAAVVLVFYRVFLQTIKCFSSPSRREWRSRALGARRADWATRDQSGEAEWGTQDWLCSSGEAYWELQWISFCNPVPSVLLVSHMYLKRGKNKYTSGSAISAPYILFFLHHLSLLSLTHTCNDWWMISLLCSVVRESEDTALLLLKEIYDKEGVTLEQPQQWMQHFFWP